MAYSIQHGLVVKPGRFDNECVLFPTTHRVAHVRRQGELVGKLAAVCEDLSVQVTDFIKNHRQTWSLNDFYRLGEQVCAREALDFDADVRWIGLGSAPADQFRGIGTHGYVFRFPVDKNVARVLMLRADLHSGHADFYRLIDDSTVEAPHFRGSRDLMKPDARQVGLAIRGARQWSTQV